MCSLSRLTVTVRSGRGHASRQDVELVALLEERLVSRVGVQQRRYDVRRLASARHLLQQFAETHHFLQRSLQRLTEDLAAIGESDDARLNRTTNQESLELAFVLDVGFGAASFGADTAAAERCRYARDR